MSSPTKTPAFPDCMADPVVIRLPVELWIACLYEADLPTRVRASHVSRAWRELIIGERGLWTDYHLKSIPKNLIARRSSLEFLNAVLRRSNPLPFRLHYPYQPVFQNGRYVLDIFAVVRPHRHRLQEYEGSEHVFACLNPDSVPLPNMQSLAILESSAQSLSDVLMLADIPSPRCVPNLRRLVGPIFDPEEQIYPALEELVCTLQSVHSDDLFRSFPNLVRAELYGRHATQLPRGPVPRTIREIIIHGEPLGPIPGLGFESLRAWAGESIPRLTLIGAVVLKTIVEELLAVHPREPTRLAISTGERDITLESSGWCWQITTRGFWDSHRWVGELHRLFTSVHIVALSLHIGRLGAFLGARLEAPHLETLELCLTGTPDGALSDTDYLRAPHLRHLTLDVGGTHAEVRAHMDDINTVLAALSINFRTMLVYDAELLETVTARTTTRSIAEIDCANYAQFARRYVEVT